MAFFGRKKLGRIRKSHAEESFGRQLFRGLVRLCILAVIIVSIWYITRLEVFTIREMAIQGGETISHDEVRAELTNEIEGTYFLIIPKRFTYLYPHDRMMEVLLGVPRVRSATITRSSLTSLSISFEEYLPYALWCSLGQPEKPCLFVDENGYAFAEAPLLQGGALIRHNVEGITTQPFTDVIAGSELTAIHTFIKRAEEEFGLRITSLTHKENGDIEFLVNGGGQIYASEGKDFHTTFENLSSVLKSPEYKHIAAGNFKYIDIRFDNKVFLNEEIGVTATAAAEQENELSE